VYPPELALYFLSHDPLILINVTHGCCCQSDQIEKYKNNTDNNIEKLVHPDHFSWFHSLAQASLSRHFLARRLFFAVEDSKTNATVTKQPRSSKGATVTKQPRSNKGATVPQQGGGTIERTRNMAQMGRNNGQGRWSDGLCDCMSDPNSCIVVWCCPCIAISNIQRNTAEVSSI